jgi:hypothetical protein
MKGNLRASSTRDDAPCQSARDFTEPDSPIEGIRMSFCFPVLLVLNDNRMFRSLKIGQTTKDKSPGTESALDQEVV